MLRKVLRALAFLAYLGVVLAVFVFAGYFSFSLFVRSGATRTPEVGGLPIEEARGVLADQGLEIRVEEEGRYDAAIGADRVLQQTPAAGSLVKRGAPVTVVPSLGPRRIEVPDLAGQGLQSAQVLLAAAGLELGRTIQVLTDGEGGAEPGTVVEQAPPPGSLVAPADAVDLLLATPAAAETFVMPDLVYRDIDRVRRFFQGRGFRLGSVKFERYEGVPRGVILRQFPLAGHPLGRRDTISLVAAAGPREEEAGPGGPTPARPAARPAAPTPGAALAGDETTGRSPTP